MGSRHLIETQYVEKEANFHVSADRLGRGVGRSNRPATTKESAVDPVQMNCQWLSHDHSMTTGADIR